MTIRLQPAVRPDGVLPYPFFIDEKGNVGRQDFWKGKPKKLEGFNPEPKTGVMDGTITLEQFLQNPKSAVGMYPIFSHKGGNFYTFAWPIKTIIVQKGGAA